jgi:hypothetical protein
VTETYEDVKDGRAGMYRFKFFVQRSCLAPKRGNHGDNIFHGEGTAEHKSRSSGKISEQFELHDKRQNGGIWGALDQLQHPPYT